MGQQTEMMAELEECIDAMSPLSALSALLDGQIAAAASVRVALPQISEAAGLVSQTIRAGGALQYVAAGSSGLMALADCSELSGTFGIPQSQLGIHMAGGVPVSGEMPGDTEDDSSHAADIVSNFSPKDLVVAVSASGTTAFPCEIARRARQRGIAVVGIANNVGSELLQLANISIHLPTPPEVLAGSTRLGAGTAQKITLNMISTLAGILLGHVYNGQMVNLNADNAKLRNRAAGIVATIAGVSVEQANAALIRANGNAKHAVLVSLGSEFDHADQLLKENDGCLGPCLDAVKIQMNS